MVWSLFVPAHQRAFVNSCLSVNSALEELDSDMLPWVLQESGLKPVRLLPARCSGQPGSPAVAACAALSRSGSRGERL